MLELTIIVQDNLQISKSKLLIVEELTQEEENGREAHTSLGSLRT